MGWINSPLTISTFIVFCSPFILCHFESEENAKLLLISFDGFRWDYLQKIGRERTPNFHKLIDAGVHPKSVKNAYITRTFPNHWSIATGLYEESHGIIDNHFYDPTLKETFTITPQQMTEPKWWDSGIGALPIWAANQKGGENRKSGAIFYAGSLVPFDNILPYQSLGQFNNSVPFQEIIDTVLKWFMDENQAINFGAVYIYQPDRAGHDYGPNSQQVEQEIIRLDSEVVGRILTKLNSSEDLRNDLNIILTSDHGMTQTSRERVVILDKFDVDKSLYDGVFFPPTLHIIPKPGKLEEVYQKFKSIPHLHTWKRGEIPAGYHYTHNARIGEIFVMAESGWLMADNESTADAMFSKSKIGGAHGYNNSLPDMHPFFIGHGPAFKRGYKRDSINVVDIYPLMCHILGVTGGVNNGSLDNVSDMLVPHKEEEMTTTFVTFLLVVIGASLVAGVFTISFICSQRRNRPVVRRRVRLLDQTNNGLDMSSKPMLLGASDEELDL